MMMIKIKRGMYLGLACVGAATAAGILFSLSSECVPIGNLYSPWIGGFLGGAIGGYFFGPNFPK